MTEEDFCLYGPSYGEEDDKGLTPEEEWDREAEYGDWLRENESYMEEK